MELLCASICSPTLMSIQYEFYKKHVQHEKEKVHMQEHRTGAKGNFLLFQLPYEEMWEKFGRLHAEGNKPPQLPRTGDSLREAVQVLLMKQGEKVEPEVIKQATVRRDVVVELIREMHDRQHREYDINMHDVCQHAKEHLVPHAKDGMTPMVPLEVLAVLDKHLNVDKRRGGKASAPPDPLVQGDGDAHATSAVTAVMMEATDDVEADMNVRTGTAYMRVAQRLGDGDRTPQAEGNGASSQAEGEGVQLGILSGGLRSQLDATFWTAAFPFLFPYSVGMPDLKYQPRDRRAADDKQAAPTVDFVEDWSMLIIQRAEQQFRRDLQFGFAVWNLVFRTIVNIGSNLYAVSRVATSEQCQSGEAVDGTVFRDAAVTLLQALEDRYTMGGRTLPVDGDLQKVRHTPAVKNNPVAQKMLASLQATFSRIPGTQEATSREGIVSEAHYTMCRRHPGPCVRV